MHGESKDVFLSYASEDSEAAQRIADALKAAAIDVWFDRSELRGGDAWDRSIRERIQECRLFIALISANTQARDEGYFRREWKLAVDRMSDMAEKKTFLLPVAIDETPERGSLVPERFHDVQWSRLSSDSAAHAFATRVRNLLYPDAVAYASARSTARNVGPEALRSERTRLGLPVRWWRWVPLLGLVALAAIWSMHSNWQRLVTPGASHSEPTPLRGLSIAVLPFEDLSGSHDQQMIGDGMAEQVLDRLANLPALSVVARSSSFQYRNNKLDLRSVGNRLGTRYVVDGTIQRSGSQLRVTPRLIDTQSDTQLWSRTFDGSVSQSLATQEEIATAIARQLQLAVGAIGFADMRTTSNPDAYALYLKGRAAYESMEDTGSVIEAQTNLEQALALDPTFARAAEALAWVHAANTLNQGIGSEAGWQAARTAAERAIHMDDRLASPHAVLALVHADFEYDWKSADQEVDKALALNPRDPVALDFSARIASHEGHHDIALKRIETSLVLDPLNPNALNTKCWVGLFAGELQVAEQACRKSQEVSPKWWGTHTTLAYVLLARGKLKEALDEARKEPEDGYNSSSANVAGLASVYGAMGKLQESDKWLPRIATLDPYWPMGTALAYGYRRDIDAACRWLEIAYQKRDPDLALDIKGHPALAPVRPTPCYKAVLRKLNMQN